MPLSPNRQYPLSRASMLNAGVPELYWNASLAAMADSPFQKRLMQYLVKIHEHVSAGRGLYLCGDFETGKTYAAVALLKEVLRRGGTAYFLKAKNVLRAIYEDEETVDGMALVKNTIKGVDLLVLDDLGQEGFDPKKHGGAELEGVIRDRYDWKKPVIVTSNRAPSALKGVYTEAFVNILRRTVLVVTIQTDQWKGSK